MNLGQDIVSSVESPKEVFPRDLFYFFIPASNLIVGEVGGETTWTLIGLSQSCFAFLHVQCWCFHLLYFNTTLAAMRGP